MDINISELFNDIQEIVNQGSSLKYAISVVCKDKGYNPHKIYNMYFKDSNGEINEPELIVGSFVILNKSPDEKYEIVNNINDNKIILRNVETNEQISVSKEEITPVIMENRMKTINEAQYNISIDGLETQNADALSQLFTAAAQAESSSVNNPMDTLNTGVDFENPMGMDDDITFDEELPADTVIPEPESTDNAFDTAMSDEPIANMGMDDMNDIGMFDENSDLDEDLLLNKDESDPSYVAQNNDEENMTDLNLNLDEDDTIGYDVSDAMDVASITDDTLNEHIDSILKTAGVQLDESDEEDCEKCDEEECKCDEEDELDEGIKDYLPRAGFIRSDDNDKSSRKMGGFIGQGTDEQIRKAKIIAKVKFANGDRMGRVSKDDLDNFDEYYAQYKEIYGDELDEAENEELENSSELKVGNTVRMKDTAEEFKGMEGKIVDSYEIGQQLYDTGGVAYVIEFENGKQYDALPEEFEVISDSTDIDTAKRWDTQGNWDDGIDESINNALRNAGVELDEAEIGEKSPSVDVPSSTKEDESKVKYRKVDTDDFGKEASEGAKKPANICMESTVNKSKIKKIYETAKSMYSKKDSTEWLKLDRRYIEKLIKEGVGYTTATKMILDAKKKK